jgi:hypothetical protein
LNRKIIINSLIIFLFLLACQFFGPAIYNLLTEDREAGSIRSQLNGKWILVDQKGYGAGHIFRKQSLELGKYYYFSKGKLPRSYQVLLFVNRQDPGHKEHYIKFKDYPLKIVKLNNDTLSVAFSLSVGNPVGFIDIYKRIN